jgi:hypothetical protein
MLRRRRRRGLVARREAGSVEEMVLQIAVDKGRGRFKPTAPGTERPRDVFLAAVDRRVEPLVESGYRYARSGPHATRREGHVTSRVQFSSSQLNVPGELVSLHISLQVRDSVLGKWRRNQAQPRRSDDVVATWHLGHLLDPPRWLDWNLASPPDRDATVADIASTLQHGLAFTDLLAEDLHGVVDPASLAGRVDDEALIEYYVKAERADETAPIIEAMLSRFHRRNHFLRQVERMRKDGLPDRQVLGVPNGLAYLVVQYDLPVSLG